VPEIKTGGPNRGAANAVLLWAASRRLPGRTLAVGTTFVAALAAAFALSLTGIGAMLPGLGLPGQVGPFGGLGQVPPVAAAGPEVTIVDGAYKPATLTITQGDAITWTNVGTRQHTVTADGGTFDSGPLSPTDVFGNLFDKAGTFTYHDSLDPAMRGTVTVKAAKPTPSPNGTPRPSPPAGTLPPGFKTPQPQVTPAPSATASSAPSPSPTAILDGSGDGSGGLGGPLVALVVVVVVAAAAIGLFATRRRRGSSTG
jgi:plastocyanin